MRNGISTIGLQSFSCQSKGLLKHSAAQHRSPSLSLFLSFHQLAFSSVVSLCRPHFFYLAVFLSLSIPSDFLPSSFVKEKGRHEYHTQTLSHSLHSNITAARFFPSQVNHSTPFFLPLSLSLSLQEMVVKVYSLCTPFIFNFPYVESKSHVFY